MGRVRILVFVSILILCVTSENSVFATDKNKDPIPLAFNLRFDNFEKEGERASLFLAGFETRYWLLRFSYLQAVRNFDDKKKYTNRKDIDLAFGIFGLKCRDLDYLWNKWKPEKEEGKPDIIYLMEHLGFIVQVAYWELLGFSSDTKPGFNIHGSFALGYAAIVEFVCWLTFEYFPKHLLKLILGKQRVDPVDPLEIDDVFIGEGEIGIGYRFTKVPLSLSLGYNIWGYRISEQTLKSQGSTLKIIYRF